MNALFHMPLARTSSPRPLYVGDPEKPMRRRPASSTSLASGIGSGSSAGSVCAQAEPTSWFPRT